MAYVAKIFRKQFMVATSTKCPSSLATALFREVMTSILESLPQDPTLPEEKLFAALFNDQVGEVIKCANEIDIWLAAHLADMMHPLGLLVESEG